MNKIALLALLSMSSLWPMAAAAQCPMIVHDMVNLRSVRIEMCAELGTGHPDCLAQESEEKAFLLSIDAYCSSPQGQCLRVRRDYRVAWEQRSRICRAAGSSSAADCVAAMQREDARLGGLIQCAINEG